MVDTRMDNGIASHITLGRTRLMSRRKNMGSTSRIFVSGIGVEELICVSLNRGYKVDGFLKWME